MMCTKVSDVSNEVRPPCVSSPWVDCLLEEFFHQVAIVPQVSLWS